MNVIILHLRNKTINDFTIPYTILSDSKLFIKHKPVSSVLMFSKQMKTSCVKTEGECFRGTDTFGIKGGGEGR